MKLFICAFALVAMAYAAPESLTKEGLARIISYDQDQKDDGAYAWKYETENGISAGETNVPQPAGPNGEPAPSVQGGFRYTAPDGSVIERTYTAGEGGFVVAGNDIPQAPPIPEEILKSLAWNAAHPEEEAQWDPAYKGAPVPVPVPVYPGRK